MKCNLLFQIVNENGKILLQFPQKCICSYHHQMEQEHIYTNNNKSSLFSQLQSSIISAEVVMVSHLSLLVVNVSSALANSRSQCINMPENIGRLLSIRDGTDIFLLHFIKTKLKINCSRNY